MCFAHKSPHGRRKVFSYLPLVVLLTSAMLTAFACLLNPSVHEALAVSGRSGVADTIIIVDKIITTWWFTAIIVVNFCKRERHMKLLELIRDFESTIENQFCGVISSKELHSNAVFYILTLCYIFAVVYQTFTFLLVLCNSVSIYILVGSFYFIVTYLIHLASVYVANFVLCLAVEVETLNGISELSLIPPPLEDKATDERKYEVFLIITKFINIIECTNEVFGIHLLLTLILCTIVTSYYLYFFAWIVVEPYEFAVTLVFSVADFSLMLPYIFVVILLTRNGQVLLTALERTDGIVRDTLMDTSTQVALNGCRTIHRGHHQPIRIMAHLYQLDYRFILYVIIDGLCIIHLIN